MAFEILTPRNWEGTQICKQVPSVHEYNMKINVEESTGNISPRLLLAKVLLFAIYPSVNYRSKSSSYLFKGKFQYYCFTMWLFSLHMNLCPFLSYICQQMGRHQLPAGSLAVWVSCCSTTKHDLFSSKITFKLPNAWTGIIKGILGCGLILTKVSDRFSMNFKRCKILLKCLMLPKMYKKTYIN